MNYNHAERKELDDPIEPSISDSTSSDVSVDEKEEEEEEEQWHPDEERDSLPSLPAINTSKHSRPSKRSKPYQHRGILKLRPTEDDLPTNWWFASTAIPLIAATFAPMANLMSIAALVVPWRNNVVDFDDPALYQSTSVGFPDPKWCIDLNIASLVCGFVGNLFLLFNFTKRIRYIVALPATIIFFFLASGILTAITATMNVYVPPNADQVYSQGFWNAILAAALYMFNSLILLVNMAGYFLGHYPQHFTLSDEQRNLILQTMLFFIWLGGGAGVFSSIQESWGYPDALYFCDVTILTIGFGDYTPTGDVGRGLVFPYSVGGTIILGLMVSSIHRFARELSTVNVLRKHVETRRVNTLSRVVSVNDMESEQRHTLEDEYAHGLRPTISSPIPNPQIQRDLDAAAQKHGLQANDRPDPKQDPATGDQTHPARRIEFNNTPRTTLKEQASSDYSEPHPSQFLVSALRRRPIRRTFKIITKAGVKGAKELKRATSRSQKVIIMREEKDRFDAMRKIQLNAKTWKKWYALMVSICAFGILWCIGAVVFWQAEQRTQDMSYFEALYFCYVSLLTIGYGDLAPKSNAGKPFFVVWSLIAVPTMTILVSDMGETVISSFKRSTFKIGDFTILPKAGQWHDFLRSHSIIWNWIVSRAEKRDRAKQQLPVGPSEDAGLPDLTIEDLADDNPSEAEMTKRLAWAIRRTADDLQHAPGKRYTYEQWCDFTRLIRFSRVGLEACDEAEDGVVDWDWLEETSPMLSGQTESEWILDRLCESLLRLLKKNMLGLAGTPLMGNTPTSSSANFRSPTSDGAGTSPSASAFSFSRRPTFFENQTWDSESGLNTGKRRKRRTSTGNSGTGQGQSRGQGDNVTDPNDTSFMSPPSSLINQRRRRASGADALLTFFTGDRGGSHAYATEAPQWSRKAQERAKEGRRNSLTNRRRGPFSGLAPPSATSAGSSGGLGGGRGGAGARTMRARQSERKSKSKSSDVQRDQAKDKNKVHAGQDD
ncbi:hypothetical protein B0A52_06133 [Exophiala mesophila]|uniref:Potassium channel domain-containing protein n=1 Tax=Exophiala mesophila TaxID=212818 RepID=A0A438N5E2_EXOME|nr:hypothetical protein B0A52_06133 [Exophiala mesophila]